MKLLGLIGKLLILSFIVPGVLSAQLFPKEGSKLNYRLIGFSFPAAEQAGNYRLEIASGNQTGDQGFRENIVVKKESKTANVIAEVPSFGSQYTWRTVSVTSGGKERIGELHHFSTTIIPEVDTNVLRLRVIDQAVKYKDAYVFVDGNKALYDMHGRAVWHLPVVDKMPSQRAMLRDMKLSPIGTITFLQDDRAYEINYNGDVLWKAPNTGAVSGEKTEHYHHEFTRLANGHYMILGMETVPWTNKNVMVHDTGLKVGPGSGVTRDRENARTTFGTIIEYDEQGKLVWSWKSSKYFIGSDLEDYNPKFKMRSVDVHENSFYFDEQNGVIYVGFKGISRIVKVKYPEGNVIASYGETYKPGVQEKGNGLFCDQHNCSRSEKGYLYLYNNNVCNEGQFPKVMMLQEPRDKKGGLKTIWEYECNDKDVNVGPRMAMMKERQIEAQKKMGGQQMDRLFMMHPTSGGSVQELPDQSLLVCMNTEYCKVFIVSKEKRLLWNAVSEKYSQADKQWIINDQQYRASLIDRQALERLISKSFSGK